MLSELLPHEMENLRLILAWLEQFRLPDDIYADIPYDTWVAVRNAGNDALTRVLE